MGSFCECECVHDLSDNFLEKLGASSNPCMEPSSVLTTPETTEEDTKILDSLVESTIIGKSSGNPKDVYSFKDKLAETPSGKIYLVQKKNTKELRMLKTISKKKDSQKKISQEIKKEITNLEKLSHPNILQLFEVYENDNYLSYITEYCEGGPLSKNLKNFKKNSEIPIACIIFQVLLVLNYCHKNKIIHSCLNPDFILLKNKLKQGYPEVKLYGFGLSKIYFENPTESEYAPNYFAPEVLLEIYNEKCDLWSCGVILHVLLSGKFPFKGKNSEEVIEKIKKGNFVLDEYFFKKVSNSAKDLIKKLLLTNPEERLSAEEALQHEWFQNLKIKEKLTEIKISTIQEIFTNINKFKITNPLQIPALDFIIFIIRNTNSQEDFNNATKLFIILDTNNDGVITQEEFITKMTEIYEEQKQKISKDELKRIFDLICFDYKNNCKGKINFKEMCIAVCNKNTILKEENLEKAFAFFDKDNKKKILIEDIKTKFKRDKAYSENDFTEIMKKIDINNDGSIDYNEFKKMMAEIILE